MDLIEKILKESQIYDFTPLPLELIESLNAYVHGIKKASSLKLIEKYSKNLPAEYKIAPKFIFRFALIPETFVNFPGGVRSWTETYEKAVEIADNNYYPNKNKLDWAVFRLETQPERVILNFDSLVFSNFFKNSCLFYEKKHNNQKIKEFREEAESIERKELEIIYNQPILTEKDIFKILDNQ